ncbi:DUF4912 domain-containing protein [Brevibacillus dissolubilis]|uniref:DUF4912 domain-containing protein n=1 Tax=Brevibacillus dissolubilis TaxID=1844116 RepID=UPI002100244B|nr:DUF4912 domain-containing protein [Brevibacillus dissolubilis]
MIERIMELRSQSLTVQEIADACGLTLGQVKYQLRRHKIQEEQTAIEMELALARAQAAAALEGAKGQSEMDDPDAEACAVDGVIETEVVEDAPATLHTDEVTKPVQELMTDAFESSDEISQAFTLPFFSEATQSQLLQSSRPTGWQLSDFYGDSVCKAMPQGPTVLYAYWEITWARMRMVASYLQADYRYIQKGLRIYDVTDLYFDGANAHWHKDVIVHSDARSWFVPQMQPGRTYIVDFGLFHEGKFCPILRSQPVATPRNTPAGWGEPLVSPASNPSQPAWFENFSSYTVYSK